MQEYKDIQNNVFDWIQTTSEFSEEDIFKKYSNMGTDKKKFITVSFGSIEEVGIINNQEYTKKDDETLVGSIYHKYKQKLEIEFYGKDTDHIALKLMQSIAKSSTLEALEILSVQDEAMLNTTIPITDGFEERYLLSFFMYFGVSSTVEVGIINSIEFNGKVRKIDE
jgi:hypothetical protein